VSLANLFEHGGGGPPRRDEGLVRPDQLKPIWRSLVPRTSLLPFLFRAAIDKSYQAAYGRRRPCLALDLPRHRDSDDSHEPDVTYTSTGYSVIVRGFLDRLRWTAVDVVGWSLGGHIGLELLASDPRLRSSIICARCATGRCGAAAFR